MLRISAVLGDPTRYGIYQHITEQGGPVTAHEVAQSFNLHPNVARMHLNKLKEIGLLDVHIEKSGRGGRPGYSYALADRELNVTFPPRDYKVLAELLCQALATQGNPARSTLHQVGEEYGRRLAAIQHALMEVDEEAPTADRLQKSLSAALAQHGLTVEVQEAPNGHLRLTFKNCSFKEVAARYPQLICQLCEGIVKGVVAGETESDPAVAHTDQDTPSLSRGGHACIYESHQ